MASYCSQNGRYLVIVKIMFCFDVGLGTLGVGIPNIVYFRDNLIEFYCVSLLFRQCGVFKVKYK